MFVFEKNVSLANVIGLHNVMFKRLLQFLEHKPINWVRGLKEFQLVLESVKDCEVRNINLNYLQPCVCKKIQRSINCAPNLFVCPLTWH